MGMLAVLSMNILPKDCNCNCKQLEGECPYGLILPPSAHVHRKVLPVFCPHHSMAPQNHYDRGLQIVVVFN